MILLVLIQALLTPPEDINSRTGASWPSLPQALTCAAKEDRPVLIYIHADWCAPCRRMEREVFPAVAPLLRRFALSELVFDDQDTVVAWREERRSPADWAKELGVTTTPSFVFLNSSGQPIGQVSGFIKAERFALLLAYITTKAYRYVDFESYERRTPVPKLERTLLDMSPFACSENTDLEKEK